MKQQRGLGRGLNALLSDESLTSVVEGENLIKLVNINDVEPNLGQPRKTFNEEELNELSKSILEHGIIQPLIVRERNGKYEIVAGERRFKAASMAGYQKVPCIVQEYTDLQSAQIALIENIQRENLKMEQW